MKFDKTTGEDINVRGTPTFIINDKMYTGNRNFDVFKEIADVHIKNK